LARSISLAAYRALAARGQADTMEPPAPRPEGELVWLHATSPGRLAAMQDVARRMKAHRAGLNVLITYNGFALSDPAGPKRGADWIVALGADTPAYVRAFLNHWRPDLCVWTGGHFLPFTLVTAQEKGVSMLLVDADADGIRSSAGRWIPSLAGKSLSCFERIFASDPETAQMLLRKGIPMSRITVTAPLQVSGNAPAVNEDEVDEVGAILAGRLIWLAANVQLDEIDTILEAHINAARLAHRLLLVLTPGHGVTTAELCERLGARGLRFVDWETGEAPNDFCQVIIAEGGPDMGLWYRLAPVSFIGSSLTPGHGGCNPFDAAALGSAVLYGPNIREHMALYSRLASVGAARIVKDADGLGAGVIQLIAPDHAASMALAAWEVVSAGAQITDELLDLVQDTLDRRQGA